MNKVPENSVAEDTKKSVSAEQSETNSESEEKARFDYRYSAPNSEEKRLIESIRRQYDEEEDEDGDFLQKLAAIKNMHKKASGIPKLVSVLFGVFGTLVFGLGMTCALEWNNIIAAIIVGVSGMVIMICAYPLYQVMRKRGRKKYGDEIVRLSNELCDESNDKSDKED